MRHLHALDALADANTAVFYPDRRTSGTLATQRSALVRADAPPPEVQAQRRLQSRVLRLFVGVEAEDRVRELPARRLRYFLRLGAAPWEVDLLLERIHLVFRWLPDCIGLSALRVVADAWTTSRHTSHRAMRFFGLQRGRRRCCASLRIVPASRGIHPAPMAAHPQHRALSGWCIFGCRHAYLRCLPCTVHLWFNSARQDVRACRSGKPRSCIGPMRSRPAGSVGL